MIQLIAVINYQTTVQVRKWNGFNSDQVPTSLEEIIDENELSNDDIKNDEDNEDDNTDISDDEWQ